MTARKNARMNRGLLGAHCSAEVSIRMERGRKLGRYRLASGRSHIAGPLMLSGGIDWGWFWAEEMSFMEYGGRDGTGA